ncbi:MAG: Fic family protein, partial [Polyangiaceae bacterium]
KAPAKKGTTDNAKSEKALVPQVELAPRSTASVAPSIPIPVREVERVPTLDERAHTIDARLRSQSADFLSQYDENVDMSWIYHDTALEGVVYTFTELTTAFRSNEVTVVDSSVMPIYDAIRRHKAAIAFARDLAGRKRFTVNVDLLKELHSLFCPDDGDAKMVKYRREIPQHRMYFHDYAAPDKIAHRVRVTLDWLADPETKKNVSPLRIAAKAHYDLARVYPFSNSSGKIARLIMNIILMRNGLPPAIIHATERQRYYETLKAPTAASLVQMLEDTLNNSLLSIQKMLDDRTQRGGD